MREKADYNNWYKIEEIRSDKEYYGNKAITVNRSVKESSFMKAAVLGYGTVGGGVVDVLFENKDAIASRVGEEIEVKYILDIRTFPGRSVPEDLNDYE